MSAPAETHNFVLVVEGQRKPLSIDAPVDASAVALLSSVRALTGREDLTELLWEDIDEAIHEEERLVTRLEEDFRLLHATSGGSIQVIVRYENQEKAQRFRPSTTLRRVISWAISPEGFNLIGQPSEFQIKFEGRVVPPDTHVGQLGRCEKAINLLLVHNIKPQGC
jgi:hypothetical protein